MIIKVLKKENFCKFLDNTFNERAKIEALKVGQLQLELTGLSRAVRTGNGARAPRRAAVHTQIAQKLCLRSDRHIDHTLSKFTHLNKKKEEEK